MRISVLGVDCVFGWPSRWKPGLGRLRKRVGKWLRRWLNMASHCERLQESANHRVGHVSVNYKNLILIWGGYVSDLDQQYYPPDEVKSL